MASSTPTRRSRDRRAEEDDIALADSPDSRSSEQFNATVRYPPRDALRLFSSAEAQDLQALNSFARQFADARTHSRSHVAGLFF